MVKCTQLSAAPTSAAPTLPGLLACWRAGLNCPRLTALLPPTAPACRTGDRRWQAAAMRQLHSATAAANPGVHSPTTSDEVANGLRGAAGGAAAGRSSPPHMLPTLLMLGSSSGGGGSGSGGSSGSGRRGSGEERLRAAFAACRAGSAERVRSEARRGLNAVLHGHPLARPALLEAVCPHLLSLPVATARGERPTRP